MLKRTTLLLFGLLSLSLLFTACGGGSSSSAESSSPEEVATAAYEKMAEKDWQGVCSYTSADAFDADAFDVVVQQIQAQEKQFQDALGEKNVQALGEDPDCAQALAWLDQATEKLSGQSLSDNVPTVVEGSEKITGDKATVEVEYSVPTGDPNSDTIKMVKEDDSWKINE